MTSGGRIRESSSPSRRCLYRELVGIYERDSRYDHYLNSQECLFNPVAAFLANYSSLLRADLDTFPTPGILGLRPKKVK